MGNVNRIHDAIVLGWADLKDDVVVPASDAQVRPETCGRELRGDLRGAGRGQVEVAHGECSFISRAAY